MFLVSPAFIHNLKICSYSSTLKSLNLQILMQWLRFLVRSLFLSWVQISFMKLNDRSTLAVKGGINEPSKMMWWSEKGESIQDLSRISNIKSCWLPRMATFSSNFWMIFLILISFCLLDIDFNSFFQFCYCVKSCLALASAASCWFSHFSFSLKTKVLNTLYWTGKVSLLSREGITTLFNFTFWL